MFVTDWWPTEGLSNIKNPMQRSFPNTIHFVLNLEELPLRYLNLLLVQSHIKCQSPIVNILSPEHSVL